MRARTYATEALARVAIAQIDAAHGYPRTYRGVDQHGEPAGMVVTTTDVEPIRLRDGTWSVRSDRLALASLPTTGERDVRDDVPADGRP